MNDEMKLATLLCKITVSLVQRDGPDLSQRQLGVFLTCYLNERPQTVKGLAAELKVSKPAITRALDRLEEFDFLRRKSDTRDRRNVFAVRTVKGSAFFRDLKAVLLSHAKDTKLA